jgi:hypothetical protein
LSLFPKHDKLKAHMSDATVKLTAGVVTTGTSLGMLVMHVVIGAAAKIGSDAMTAVAAAASDLSPSENQRRVWVVAMAMMKGLGWVGIHGTVGISEQHKQQRRGVVEI